jgi:hypothetical protein
MKHEQSEKSAEHSLPGDGKLHKPPSMLWFVSPLGLLMVYALLTR